QPAERGVLEVALENPDDPEARQALVRLLDEHARNDPEFARQMRDLWTDALAELGTAMGSATNTVRGEVGESVVQARDGEADQALQDARGRSFSSAARV